MRIGIPLFLPLNHSLHSATQIESRIYLSSVNPSYCCPSGICYSVLPLLFDWIKYYRLVLPSVPSQFKFHTYFLHLGEAPCGFHFPLHLLLYMCQMEISWSNQCNVHIVFFLSNLCSIFNMWDTMLSCLQSSTKFSTKFISYPPSIFYKISCHIIV